MFALALHRRVVVIADRSPGQRLIVNSDPQSLCPPLSATTAPALSKLKNLSDEQLMDLLKGGCHDAMTVLFLRYHKLVLSISSKILRDHGEAEDVMQEVFFDLYRKADRFDAAKGTAKVWLLQLTYAKSLNRRDYLLLRQANGAHAPTYSEAAISDNSSTPNGRVALTLEERTRMMQQAMAILPVKQRQAIDLACFQGLDIHEIAAHMQESVVNARNHYYRGLRKLRVALDALQTQPRDGRSLRTQKEVLP
jgi:RNA polymerase sigma-70 factor (ECF subfamily)